MATGGSSQAAFFTLAIVGAIGVVIILLLPRTERKTVAQIKA